MLFPIFHKEVSEISVNSEIIEDNKNESLETNTRIQNKGHFWTYNFTKSL